MQRPPPRKLQYLKCDRCRKDRQKCTPVDRDWPDRRCDRCIKFDYPCSESVTAQGALQRGPNISRGKQPARPDDNAEERNDCSPEPIHQSDYPTMENTTGSELLYAPPCPANSPIGAKPRPRCAELFGIINLPSLDILSEPELLASRADSTGSHLNRLLSCFALAEWAVILQPLKYRNALIGINDLHQKHIEMNIADGIPRNKSTILAATQLIEVFIERRQRNVASQSTIDLLVSGANTFREGKRWQELIDIVGYHEILLIGGECDINDDDDDDDDGIKSAHVLEERFFKNCNSINVGKITRNGSNEVFAKMKELILTPELQLKETCQRLSGLYHKIILFIGLDLPRLGKIEHLDSTIFKITKMDRQKYEADFKLISTLTLEILRRIEEVIGQPTPKSDDEDISSDDEDISSDDDDSEEISGSAQGNKDRDFDDDFCINFQNNAAFASADWI